MPTFPVELGDSCSPGDCFVRTAPFVFGQFSSIGVHECTAFLRHRINLLSKRSKLDTLKSGEGRCVSGKPTDDGVKDEGGG